jgi:hypothetical protein
MFHLNTSILSAEEITVFINQDPPYRTFYLCSAAFTAASPILDAQFVCHKWRWYFVVLGFDVERNSLFQKDDICFHKNSTTNFDMTWFFN